MPRGRTQSAHTRHTPTPHRHSAPCTATPDSAGARARTPRAMIHEPRTQDAMTHGPQAAPATTAGHMPAISSRQQAATTPQPAACPSQLRPGPGRRQGHGRRGATAITQHSPHRTNPPARASERAIPLHTPRCRENHPRRCAHSHPAAHASRALTRESSAWPTDSHARSQPTPPSCRSLGLCRSSARGEWPSWRQTPRARRSSPVSTTRARLRRRVR